MRSQKGGKKRLNKERKDFNTRRRKTKGKLERTGLRKGKQETLRRRQEKGKSPPEEAIWTQYFS